MSVRLLLSAGRGRQECAWAVARLLRRLETDAGRRGVAIRRISRVAGEGHDTFRSVLIMLAGDGAADVAAAWTGTLCWQAPSPYRTSTGRKNWYVTARRVEVDTPRTVFTESDVDVVACRTGGPGGQHRNKVNTAARATHRPSDIVVVVDTERQFGLNRSRAMRLLRRCLDLLDDASERAADTARWHVHDALVRGAPVRMERPS